MATPKGYSSYRGRFPKWKIVVIILLILVIVAAAGFMLLQRYLVYDGSGLPHFQFPEREKTSASAGKSASSGTAASNAAGSSKKKDLKIQIEQPKEKSVQALQLSETPLLDWASVQQRIQDTGAAYNSVVLTLKDARGYVYYNSTAAAAASSRAVRAQSSTAAAIAAMTASDYNTVARLSCLRDARASRADVNGKGLKNTGGYLFYDGNSENWMDPAKPATQQYLASLARECANLGFKEILLTDFSYPTKGRLRKIDYGTGEKSENLKACLTAIKTALDGTKVKLSIELPADVITTGSNAEAGLNLADLAPLVDRIYAPATAAQSQALSKAVAAANPAAAFVPEISGTVGSSQSSYLFLG